MPTRPLVALTAALAVAGASLTAATAAPSDGKAVPSKAANVVLVQLDGAATNWSAARGTVTLGGARVSGAPKAVRRAIRRGAAVTLRLSAATRVVVEDGEGTRSRVTAAALFDELDLADGEVAVEAGGRVARTARASGGRVVIPATRTRTSARRTRGGTTAATPATTRTTRAPATRRRVSPALRPGPGSHGTGRRPARRAATPRAPR